MSEQGFWAKPLRSSKKTSAEPGIERLTKIVVLTHKIGILYDEAVKVLNTYHLVATAQRMISKLETYSQALIRLQEQALQLTKDFERWMNRKLTNHNLEAMVKQLYDYWFVQFDFPNAEGKPYKSSGGKMVYNDKLKREIPEGWEVRQLGNLCSFRNGINYTKDEVGESYSIVNVRNISATSIILDTEDFDVITIPSSKASKYILTKKDIIIARSGCPGATRLLQIPNNTLFCGFIICCTPFEGNLRGYLTFQLKILEGSSATTSGGSILQNVDQDTLKSLLVAIPPIDLLMSFDKFLNDSIRLLCADSIKIKKLSILRDSLLLLLMNGQVSLNYDLSLLSYRLFLLLWEQTIKQQDNEEENYSRNTCWCVPQLRGRPNG